MSDIDIASEILNQGGIIIYPTDTAFGIGCKLDNDRAVKKLFEIKNRPKNQPVPVLFDSKDRIQEYVLEIDEKIDDLMDEYWPGALTIVLKCYTEKVPLLVRGGTNTLGVRVPDHTVPLNLIKIVNSPILGPSANFPGEKTPFSFKDLDKDLLKLVDFFIEGKTKNRNSSTVVDCTVSPWNIIRQGDVMLDI